MKKIKLTQEDIVRVVNRLLTEQELPPLADRFTDFYATSLTNNEFFEEGNLVYVIDISDYYTIRPWDEMKKVILFDKDIFKNEIGGLGRPTKFDEAIIRNLYSKGMTEKASRGDIDMKKIFKDRFFNKYVVFITNKVVNSKCQILRDPQDSCDVYLFSDGQNDFFCSVYVYSSGAKFIMIYKTFLDHFNINHSDTFFLDITKEVYGTVFDFKGEVRLSRLLSDLVDINAWSRIDTIYGEDALELIDQG